MMQSSRLSTEFYNLTNLISQSVLDIHVILAQLVIFFAFEGRQETRCKNGKQLMFNKRKTSGMELQAS